MIDIHTHILPGIDDGAADWDATFDLARAAVREGITSVIATPHHANGSYHNQAAGVTELTAEANRRLQDEGIALRVLKGQEIRIHDDLLDAWSRGELLTMADSSYMLVEMPPGSVPRGMYELIHELGILGKKAVIAHPERNAEITSHPELLADLISAGAYAQVTTHSLLGDFGKRVERHSWELCRRGLIHFVSSDAHHITRRGFRLLEAYQRMEAEIGPDAVQLYKRNAENLIADKEIHPLHSVLQENIKLWRKIYSYFHKS